MDLTRYAEDFKELLRLTDTAQIDVAKKLGITTQGVYSIVKKANVNASYVRAIEALGYDVKLTYIKRTNIVKRDEEGGK